MGYIFSDATALLIQYTPLVFSAKIIIMIIKIGSSKNDDMHILIQ